MKQEKLSQQEKDLWRANTYHLLARLLSAPPDQKLVAQLGEIPPLLGDDREEPVAQAWSELGVAARRAREDELAREYETLFSGEGAPPQRGAPAFLGKDHDETREGLAELIEENAPLGPANEVCGVMRRLVESGDPLQIGFFSRRVSPWLNQFFHDLREAKTADFYRAVGALGEAFLEVERIYLRKVY